MDDLVTWLRAQLDDDERIAGAAVNARLFDDYPDAAAIPFAERLGPEYVLAEVDAKRRIIAEHHPVDPCDAHDAESRTIACDTLRLLALAYGSRPGYRDEWKP